MNVVWSLFAQDRVLAIGLYLARQDPMAAEQVVNMLFDKVKTLANFPKMGRMVAEIKRPDVRELIVEDYRIIYHCNDQLLQVTIMTVRHTRQILPLDEIKIPK